VTSWDALEAYLSDLVRKVGGVSYVLRDSGGRHLAPRPPPAVDRTAVIQEFIRERFLEAQKEDKGDRSEPLELARLDRSAIDEAVQRISLGEPHPEPAPVQAALENRARALARYNARIARFKQHSALLDEACGVDFVRKGPGKRYVHREAALPFVAERLLSSYLLIIAFRDVRAVDAQGVVLCLERARSIISDMLGDLPPDDGGDRAIAYSQRPA